MLRKSLLLRMFEAFSIQRWNDKIRPVELTEMDKNAHKMFIAYSLAKLEEKDGKDIKWNNLIKGGIFEFLRRVVLSDIKSPVYRKIKNNHKEVFNKLNEWVFQQLSPSIDNDNIKSELKQYLKDEANILDNLSIKILNASHIYASYWEFQIIKNASPNGYQIQEINHILLKDIEKYLDLIGMRKIITKCDITKFLDIVGQLRFQIRWGNTPRIPKTSVLGHSFMVACISYFLTHELNGCNERLKNNFFGGLFHDLPEVVTRDIISPVKGSVSELSDVIKEIEKEMLEDEIYKLLDEDMVNDIKFYTEDEFSSKIYLDNKIMKVTSDDINNKYNDNKYCPLDGEIIKISDHLSAFIEAQVSIESGIKSPNTESAKQSFLNNYKGKIIGGINIGSIYADFI